MLSNIDNNIFSGITFVKINLLFQSHETELFGY
ncbi:MAG: hypothetical protein FD181_188 [Prolixibacteraceae bacterium]|nr:MAG: hypothetical protein FD181_188 [Prolixibacteraceae bacterium]